MSLFYVKAKKAFPFGLTVKIIFLSKRFDRVLLRQEANLLYFN